MANSKIQLADGTVLLDLTGDTVTAENLLEGIIAHGADGEEIIGQLAAGGGGLPEGIAAMTSGTYIPESNVSSCTIEHGLGVTPDFFILNSAGSIPYLFFNTTLIITAAVHYDSIKNGYGLLLSGGTYGSEFSCKSVSMGESPSYINGSSIKLSATDYASKAVFASGREYTWYAGVYDEVL